MKRLLVALGAYAALAWLAWTTIGEQRFRIATIAILAMFAVRTWSWDRRLQREKERERHDGSEGVASERE